MTRLIIFDMAKEILTKEEVAALSAYEFEFAAARENYLRTASKEGQRLFHEVYRRVTGKEFDRTDACGHCEFELQRAIVMWYDETRAAQAESAKTSKSAKSAKKK